MNRATQQFLQLYIPVLASVTTLRNEILELRSELKAEMQELRSELKGEIGELRSAMQEMRNLMEKQHGDLLRILADRAQRLTRLEERK